MSVGELRREVLTVFKADVNEFVDGQKKMKEHVEETEKGFVGWSKTVNEGINSGIEWLGKFNQGFEGAKKIIEFATESVKEYAENTRLAAAAGTANIERLSEAAGGLRTETELLTFAARTQHGVIHASQADMETAEKAMRMLTRAGFDQAEVSEKIERAMISLKTRGLEELGLSVEKGKTDIETYNNLMDALAKKAGGADEATESTSETVQRMGVQFHDAFEKMRIAVGKMVISLAPLVESVASIATKVGDLLNKHPELLGYGTGSTWGMAKKFGDKSGFLGGLPSIDTGKIGDFFSDLAPNLSSPSGSNVKLGDPAISKFLQSEQLAFHATHTHLDALNGAFGAGSAMFGEVMNSEQFKAALKDWVDKAKSDYKSAQEAAKALAEERKKLSDKIAKELTDALVITLGDEVDADNAASARGLVIGQKAGALDDLSGLIDKISADEEKVRAADAAKGYRDYQNKKADTMLEQLGIDKPDKLQLAAVAVQGFADTYVAAMTAMALASGTAGETFKKGLGIMVAGVGQKLFAFGAAELVEAGAHAITLDFAGAAMHLGAAGLYTAGGVAAMQAARGLGYGGATPSPSAAKPALSGASSADGTVNDHRTGQAGSGAAGQASNQPLIFVVGEHFSEMSPRQRAQEADQAVKRALGSNGGRDS